MTTRTDTHPLTERDLLELVSLAAKAEWERSLAYTVENWTWLFDDHELNTAATEGKTHVLRNALAIHADAISAWLKQHDADAAVLINAHRDRQDARLTGPDN